MICRCPRRVLQAVRDANFSTPTPVQSAAIPHVVERRDLLATAQTGTGKTAAFTLPMIDRLAGSRARARMPRALVLEPVRELALQVQEQVRLFSAHVNLSSELFIGGVNIGPQLRQAAKPIDIMIATPGRLLDLFDRGALLLIGVEMLVIDEADRMLDMGFIPEIESIVAKLPRERQTLMLSATMPPEIQRIAKRFLQQPARVSVAPRPQRPSWSSSRSSAVPRATSSRFWESCCAIPPWRARSCFAIASEPSMTS